MRNRGRAGRPSRRKRTLENKTGMTSPTPTEVPNWCRETCQLRTSLLPGNPPAGSLGNHSGTWGGKPTLVQTELISKPRRLEKSENAPKRWGSPDSPPPPLRTWVHTLADAWFLFWGRSSPRPGRAGRDTWSEGQPPSPPGLRLPCSFIEEGKQNHKRNQIPWKLFSKNDKTSLSWKGSGEVGQPGGPAYKPPREHSWPPLPKSYLKECNFYLSAFLHLQRYRQISSKK